MKGFKTCLSALAALVLAVSFVGCAEYKPPVGTPEDPNGGGEKPPVVQPGEPDAEGDFKVSLTWNGREFTKDTYNAITALRAQWTDLDTGAIFFANFNEKGVASSDKPDGDYSVTLVNLPDGFTYEPNSYRANNDFKEVSIALYKLTPLALRGGRYEPAPVYGDPIYTIDTIGAYRIQLKDENDKVFFMFTPSRQGMYSFTTMVDVTANEINPILDLHTGHSQFVNQSPTPESPYDGGGVENTYTKNVKCTYDLAANEVGGTMIFRLYSTCLNKSAYPLTVDFIFDRDGDFTNRYEASEEVSVTEDFSKTPETPAGSFTYAVARPGVENRLLNQKAVKLNEEDGYYYYIDEEGNFTDRVYARISQRTQVSDEPFTGGHMLPMMSYIWVRGDSTPRNYVNFVTTYASHCNVDGCYPVNEELKTFLQKFAVSQRYFNDGFGWAETEAGYNSDEDSQWMFACGYYAE